MHYEKTLAEPWMPWNTECQIYYDSVGIYYSAAIFFIRQLRPQDPLSRFDGDWSTKYSCKYRAVMPVFEHMDNSG